MHNVSETFHFSEDFRTIRFRGREMTLTAMQAQAAEFMFHEHQKGDTEIHQDRILTAIDSTSKRLHDLFKSTKEAWGTLIIRGTRKGMYRLNIFE